MLPARDVEAPPRFFLVFSGVVVFQLCCFCFFDLALLVESVADPSPLLPASAFALSLVGFFLFGMVLKRIGNDGRDGGTSADCSGTCRDDGWERIRFGGTGLDVGGEIDDRRRDGVFLAMRRWLYRRCKLEVSVIRWRRDDGSRRGGK